MAEQPRTLEELNAIVCALEETYPLVGIKAKLNDICASLESFDSAAVAELTSKIDGLSGLSASIASLQSTVSGLSSQNNSIQTTQEAIKAALDATAEDVAIIEAALSDTASSSDVAAILALAVDIQTDVTELLQKNSLVNQDIIINNSATLELGEVLINTGADALNVIVNGNVTVSTITLTAAEQVRANAICSKISTVLGNVTASSTTPITFTNLSLIDGDYTVEGSDMDDSELRTITGNLNIGQMVSSFNIDYSHVSSVQNIYILAQTANNASSVNFAGTDFSSIDTGAGPHNTEFPNATSVRIDGPIRLLRAENAASIDLGMTSTLSGLNVYGGDDTIVHIDSLTTVSNLEIVANEAHLPSLTSSGNIDMQVNAAVDLSSLATINNPIDLNTCPVVLLGSLVGLNSPMTWNVETINLPHAVVSVGGNIVSYAATSITISDGAENVTGSPSATITETGA